MVQLSQIIDVKKSLLTPPPFEVSQGRKAEEKLIFPVIDRALSDAFEEFVTHVYEDEGFLSKDEAAYSLLRERQVPGFQILNIQNHGGRLEPYLSAKPLYPGSEFLKQNISHLAFKQVDFNAAAFKALKNKHPVITQAQAGPNAFQNLYEAVIISLIGDQLDQPGQNHQQLTRLFQTCANDWLPSNGKLIVVQRLAQDSDTEIGVTRPSQKRKLWEITYKGEKHKDYFLPRSGDIVKDQLDQAGFEPFGERGGYIFTENNLSRPAYQVHVMQRKFNV